MNREHTQTRENRNEKAVTNGLIKNTQPSSPKVSIIIISYNQEQFIEEAVLSAVTQDYENLEVIVSDDGSSDNTQSIIKELASKHPNRLFPILNKQNAGITANCNKALRACTGDFISLLGGDDIILPGKIRAQADWFSLDSKRVLCGTLAENILADGTKRPLQEKTDPYAKGAGPINFIRRRRMVNGTTLMFRASAIPKHGFEESITVASDFIFCVEVLMGGGEYGCVNSLYAKRRHHGNNVTRNQDKMFSDLESTYNLLGKRYPKYQILCELAIAEHVYYYQGVAKMKLGDTKNARILFLQALRKRPFYWKTIIRLVQLSWHRL
jgi:glycosyltransferase involved in cell wall biosynthesis